MASRGFGVIWADPEASAKFMAKSDADLGATMKAVGHRQVKVHDADALGARCSRRWAALSSLLSHIQGFPAMPGQKFGPALFPGLVAVGLGVCGALLALQAPRDARALARRAGAGSRAPRHVARLRVGRRRDCSSTCWSRTGSASSSPALILLVVLMRGACASLRIALPVAVVATLVIHPAFYKLLRVPLPWGIFERVRFADDRRRSCRRRSRWCSTRTCCG